MDMEAAQSLPETTSWKRNGWLLLGLAVALQTVPVVPGLGYLCPLAEFGLRFVAVLAPFIVVVSEIAATVLYWRVLKIVLRSDKNLDLRVLSVAVLGLLSISSGFLALISLLLGLMFAGDSTDMVAYTQCRP
jgi:hypothetical protein